MKKTILILLYSLFAIYGYAGGDAPVPVIDTHHMTHSWYIQAAVGHTTFQETYKNDGNTVAGRFALGLHALSFRYATLGLEIGIQNGNRMRLGLSQAKLDLLGGSPIESTVKPMADFLVTAEIPTHHFHHLFLLLKGGVAYRQWQFDRDTIPSIRKLNPDVQVGFGIRISPRTKLLAYYQGIYSAGMKFKVNPSTTTTTARVDNIPSQQGGFIGVEMAI